MAVKRIEIAAEFDADMTFLLFKTFSPKSKHTQINGTFRKLFSLAIFLDKNSYKIHLKDRTHDIYWV